MRYDILVVGSGHAGAQLAIALRQRRYSGRIGIVSEAADAPYERPPLSKAYLSGERSVDRIAIRPTEFWSTHNIDLHGRCRVATVDCGRQEVQTLGGERFGYGTLVWAAGGRPRRLTCEGAGLAGVHVIRSREDVDRVRGELDDVSGVGIVGAGFVGLEAAATLSKLGKRVIVLESMDRVLARVTAEPVSRFFEAVHASHGVELRLGARLLRICPAGTRAGGLQLADGEKLACGLVIVGIGIDPEISPLTDAGARASKGGLEVDSHLKTTLPNVFAIGDCATHVSAFANHFQVRLESVQNAVDQANALAQTLTGQPTEYAAMPWFWSEQYDIRLQTIGLAVGYDDYVVRGRPETRSFSVVYLRQGRVIALDCINCARDFTQARALIARAFYPSRAALADPEIPLKSLDTATSRQ